MATIGWLTIGRQTLPSLREGQPAGNRAQYASSPTQNLAVPLATPGLVGRSTQPHPWCSPSRPFGRGKQFLSLAGRVPCSERGRHQTFVHHAGGEFLPTVETGVSFA